MSVNLLGDLDGDGDADAVHWNLRMFWFENKNTPDAFFQQHEIPNGFLPTHLADFNQDGHNKPNRQNRRRRSRPFGERTLVVPLRHWQHPSLHLQVGKYGDPAALGSTLYSEGDWNLDGRFDSSDLVLAFQFGNYTTDTSIASVGRMAARPLTSSLTKTELAEVANRDERDSIFRTD